MSTRYYIISNICKFIMLNWKTFIERYIMNIIELHCNEIICPNLKAVTVCCRCV